MVVSERSSKLLSIVAAILFFVLLRPYFTWSFALNNQVNFFLSAALFLIFIYNKKKLLGKEVRLLLLLIFTVFFFSIRAGGNVLGLLTIMFIVSIPFAKSEFMKSVFNHFTTLYCLIVGISLISWILVLLGLVGSIGTLETIDVTKTGYYGTYLVYPLCVSQDVNIRFYGPFDEPGVVGTVSALLFFCNRDRLKSFKSIVLLLTGMFSLSLFFYIIVVVYYLIYGVSKQGRGISAIFILSLFVGLYYFTNENKIMREVIWDRFEWDSERNTIAGEDRMKNEEAFNKIRGTNEYWFGVNNKELYLRQVEGSSSYKNVIALNGMVFFCLYLLFFFLFGIKYQQNTFSFILYFMVVLATIYQRPGIFSFVWFFLFSFMARMDSINTAINNPNNRRLVNNPITV